MNNLNLLELFSESVLELIRETTARLTGLSLLVLDAQGHTLTELAAASPYCRRRRKNQTSSHICLSADAYGADQSFARRDKFIYVCPCGLIRAAIPVIARNTYLGGFFIGQVQCEHVPENTPRMEHLPDPEETRSIRLQRAQEPLESAPAYDFAYFTYLVDILAAIVGKVAEKETGHFARISEMETARTALESRVKWLERELNIRESYLSYWKSRLNLDFLINTLSLVASLAVIEQAPRTNELCVLFAGHLRHCLTTEKDFSCVKDEFDLAGNYLEMQKIRYGGLFSYSLVLPDKVSLCRAPAYLLLPFVESAVARGIEANEEGYSLALSADMEDGEVVIRIAGNAANLSGDSASSVPARNSAGDEAADDGLSLARLRLETLFGGKSIVSFGSIPGGSECVIRYPPLYKEPG
ncbi:MAG: PocR ligand-binding domain-containing protein [Deltaproteobacteria bacterium]|jgi:ligand-binding sensor protein|nr:PocR ligand-binding domain-containing protein [Deltaproteobacteria bacterium]